MLEPKFTNRLKNGTDVSVQTINSCDEKCIANEFSKLSDQSKYMRFFSSINKLSPSQLKYLTDIDNVNHVLITISKLGEDDQSGMGLGRYIRLKEQHHIAELAITVADRYQHQGVGTLLLELLIEHAKGNSIEVLQGYVLKSNMPMLKLFELHHFEHSGTEDGLPKYELYLER
ncbi:MAG: GNAT family N-acetyltransferase [Candidatus Thiodiazotropha sp. (ex Lucinoma borealis)]|nr:GNAT family N-acetyltransferase [Candidatus Thiodiazotropha sp. (ex Lucinoma borealis)]